MLGELAALRVAAVVQSLVLQDLHDVGDRYGGRGKGFDKCAQFGKPWQGGT